jgi:hypothetical protein
LKSTPAISKSSLIEARKEKLTHKLKINDKNIVNQTPTHTKKTKNHATPTNKASTYYFLPLQTNMGVGHGVTR